MHCASKTLLITKSNFPAGAEAVLDIAISGKTQDDLLLFRQEKAHASHQAFVVGRIVLIDTVDLSNAATIDLPTQMHMQAWLMRQRK